jgi:hypothetical protein
MGAKICCNLIDKIVRDIESSIRESQRQSEVAALRPAAVRCKRGGVTGQGGRRRTGGTRRSRTRTWRTASSPPCASTRSLLPSSPHPHQPPLTDASGWVVLRRGVRSGRRGQLYLEEDVLDKQVKTRLYFTSESHIHAVLNCLRYCHYTDKTLLPPGAQGSTWFAPRPLLRAGRVRE